MCASIGQPNFPIRNSPVAVSVSSFLSESTIHGTSQVTAYSGNCQDIIPTVQRLPDPKPANRHSKNKATTNHLQKLELPFNLN